MAIDIFHNLKFQLLLSHTSRISDDNKFHSIYPNEKEYVHSLRVLIVCFFFNSIHIPGGFVKTRENISPKSVVYLRQKETHN